jgi:peptidoglycan hydrolase CwlO-like protein
MGDMKSHNEALMKQIEQMESSYFASQKESAIAKGKLESAKEEINSLQDKLKSTFGNVDSMKASEIKKNQELQIQVRELMK